jgi:23S rRNA pseudouridine1911/1915/1917 synthase
MQHHFPKKCPGSRLRQTCPRLTDSMKFCGLTPASIVAETADFLVVDKPPFLQAHPTRPGDSGTLWDELRALLAYELANGGQVSLINRLDRETSGLSLVAKHRDAARHFSQLMMRRAFTKEYLAIVFGWPERDAWEVDGPLLSQRLVRPSPVWLKQCIDPTGAPARTRFAVEQRFERDGQPFALVRAFPETGRMHQIRVHLAGSGHPIVGDKLYRDEACYLEFIETGWTPALATRLLFHRQALHSCRLAVETHDWRSPLPPDLSAWMAGVQA